MPRSSRAAERPQHFKRIQIPRSVWLIDCHSQSEIYFCNLRARDLSGFGKNLRGGNTPRLFPSSLPCAFPAYSYAMQINRKMKALMFGDPIAIVYETCGKHRRILPLAFQALLVVFQNQAKEAGKIF